MALAPALRIAKRDGNKLVLNPDSLIALALDAQAGLRPDLRIVAMSAVMLATRPAKAGSTSSSTSTASKAARLSSARSRL